MDLALACQLERAEGSVGASFVPVRQRLSPEIDAAARSFDGVQAIFDGTDSPFTQTFGLGVLAPAEPARLDAIEAFFRGRGADVMHEVSPLAGVETLQVLADRGYRPLELSTVLVQEVADVGLPTTPLRVQIATADDRDRFIDASVEGWATSPELAVIMRSIAGLAFENAAMTHFMAFRDDQPIATASLGIDERVALLAGASTVPAARGCGAQGVLLAARLAEARRRGCDLAMMAALPGSTSQRNAERHGFRVAYTRMKWRLA